MPSVYTCRLYVCIYVATVFVTWVHIFVQLFLLYDLYNFSSYFSTTDIIFTLLHLIQFKGLITNKWVNHNLFIIPDRGKEGSLF